jgi:hypothetical protein
MGYVWQFLESICELYNLRNLAIFLLLGNIAWWGWQFNFHGNESVAAKDVQQAGFVQAEMKLRLLREGSPEVHADGPDQNNAGELDVPQGSPPASAPDGGGLVEVARSAPEPWCGTTNNIGSAERAKKFQAEWLKKGGEAEQESVREPGTSTWWVYLPFKDEESAQLVLKQLHEKAIDSYYMRSGDLAGSISLGVFSRKESAAGIKDGIRKKGYSAEMREIPRMETRFLLVLRLSERGKIQDSSVREFLSKYSDIQVKEINCK